MARAMARRDREPVLKGRVRRWLVQRAKYWLSMQKHAPAMASRRADGVASAETAQQTHLSAA